MCLGGQFCPVYKPILRMSFVSTDCSVCLKQSSSLTTCSLYLKRRVCRNLTQRFVVRRRPAFLTLCDFHTVICLVSESEDVKQWEFSSRENPATHTGMLLVDRMSPQGSTGSLAPTNVTFCHLFGHRCENDLLLLPQVWAIDDICPRFHQKFSHQFHGLFHAVPTWLSSKNSNNEQSIILLPNSD